MKTTILSTTLIAFFALGFLQGCEDKAEKAKQQAAAQAAAIELEKKQAELRAAELEMQKQAAELEKLKAEKAKQAKIAKEREAAQAVAQEREKKRKDLETNPSKYIVSVGGCTHNESGIVNVYTNIQACQFKNSSDFPVNNISGNLYVTASQGTKSIPFKASGRLEAGQTNMLPILGIQKVPIPGKFISSRIQVLKVTVIEP